MFSHDTDSYYNPDLLNFCFPVGDHFEYFLADSFGFYFQISNTMPC